MMISVLFIVFYIYFSIETNFAAILFEAYTYSMILRISNLLFRLNASASYNRSKQRPLVDMPAERRSVMPQFPEELREKMRRSIASEKNVNICHEGLSVISLFAYE